MPRGHRACVVRAAEAHTRAAALIRAGARIDGVHVHVGETATLTYTPAHAHDAGYDAPGLAAHEVRAHVRMRAASGRALAASSNA